LNHRVERNSTVAVHALDALTDDEVGLDVVCLHSFDDERSGRPLLFFQCASGADWSGKLHTPVLNIWDKLIDFGNLPQKGFSLPFALLEEKFLHVLPIVQGILLDRYRLLRGASVQGHSWPTDELNDDLIAWLEPRVDALPTAES